MNQKQTFSQYLLCQGKELLIHLGGFWMLVLAPAGVCILGAIAGTRTWGWHIVNQVTFYLWCGFAFCLICTLITIFLCLHHNYTDRNDK